MYSFIGLLGDKRRYQHNGSMLIEKIDILKNKDINRLLSPKQ